MSMHKMYAASACCDWNYKLDPAVRMNWAAVSVHFTKKGKFLS